LKENDVGEDILDLIIIGGGPTGLAAAAYGGTRGLKVAIIEKEKDRIGGTASESPFLENVPGFPDGITGRMWGERMLLHALKFGAMYHPGSAVKKIKRIGLSCVVTLSDKTRMESKAVVIAVGLKSRLLPLAGGRLLLPTEITYAPPFPLAEYRSKKICVVGGSNAAGQTVLAIAKQSTLPVLLVFSDADIRKSMASYLADRILRCKNIILHPASSIVAYRHTKRHRIIIGGKNGTWSDLFVDEIIALIGREPDIPWLGDEFIKDERGYLKTGDALIGSSDDSPSRLPMETSVNGVFAAGDIRSGSIKCVAVAQGEGVAAIEYIRKYLRSLEQ
jgi:thioredoxin reductase (NADPH)